MTVNVPQSGVAIAGASLPNREWFQFFTQLVRDVDGKFPISPSSSQITAMLSTLGIETGTYTPTLTNVANISASTAFATNYMRIVDMVVVAGSFQVDAVAAASTSTQMGMSLPIASAFTASSQLGGAAIQASGRQPIELLADATNDRANFFWVSQSTANENVSFIFMYRVI